MRGLPTTQVPNEDHNLLFSLEMTLSEGRMSIVEVQKMIFYLEISLTETKFSGKRLKYQSFECV